MKLNLVILQSEIPHYRKSLFNRLSFFYNVTVIHCGCKSVGCLDAYNEVILPVNRILGFNYSGQLADQLYSLRPDVIIGMADMRWVEILFTSLRKEYRHIWIWWGLDRGKYPIYSLAKHFLYRFSSGYLFYGKTSALWFSRSLPKSSAVAVAQNTVSVPISEFLSPGSEYFLNVGSLNIRKRNDLLIDAYDEYRRRSSGPVGLVFVGSGPDKSRLVNYVQERGLNDFVKFFDPVGSDSLELIDIYARSVCSISLGQAGLSILQSFGHSRGYITLESAISGTELENIKTGCNGFLCVDLSDVVDRMIQVTEDQELLFSVCENSFNYYNERASMDNMVSAFRFVITAVHKEGANVTN